MEDMQNGIGSTTNISNIIFPSSPNMSEQGLQSAGGPGAISKHNDIIIPTRCVYLFQNPLRFVTALSSASTAGIIADPSIDWNDRTEPRFSTTLPRLSAGTFDIRSHVGVIIIPASCCADSSLTLAQKLRRGIIYEHQGNGMLSSQEGIGRPVLGNELWVRSVTALEFCGYTGKTVAALDILIQDLLRVDKPISGKPPYRPIYWNCHDIAVRFAVLAADTTIYLPILHTLSTRFEHAKLYLQFLVQGPVILGTGIVDSMMSNLSGMESMLDFNVLGIVQKGYRKMCMESHWEYPSFYSRTLVVLSELV